MPDAYDDLLDRLLAGARVDLDESFRLHPELTGEQQRGLRTLARSLGSRETAPPEVEGLPFQRIGEFRILRPLGGGSFGNVYLAEQAGLGRLVAVKVLRPGLALSAEADARLSREATALARLRHPNVVTAFSFGQDHGLHFLAMEYVEGTSLNDVIAEARAGGARPTVVQITSWCRDVARALQAAHDAGIVHRDVKPANIRLTPDGRAVLVDFGLALDRPDSSLTTEGAFRGSPKYSSPEQIDARPGEVDGRTDVYSLGVTLYEAITLVSPFEGETTQAVFAKILAGNANPPRKVAPQIPRELETVILASMDHDRERRYPTAGAFARDLDALLELRDILARPPGLVRRIRKWVRRKPLAAAASAAVILAVLSVAGVVGARALADRRDFARETEAARAAASRGAFEESLAAWDRALGILPDSADARDRRAETLRLRDEGRVRALLLEARKKLDDAREARLKADAAENDVIRLRSEMAGRTLDPGEGRIVARGEGRARTWRLDQETAFHAALNRADEARALAPGAPEPEAVMAEIYLERWREALARGDAAAKRSYEKLVLEHDLPGLHKDEIAGLGSVEIDVAPEGAEVHLFRYEEQADVVQDGERRLVPVPIDGAPTPVPPGTWCLRALKAEGGLEPEDVIFEMEGRRIEGTVFVIPAQRDPGKRLETIDAIEGRPVDNVSDLISILRHSTPAESRWKLDLKGVETRRLEVSSFADLNAAVSPPWLAAPQTSFEASIWSRGAVRHATVPKGLDFRPTACPLFLSPGCSLGKAPIQERRLAPGSYLAWVSHPDRDPCRVPFVVERSSRAAVSCTLRPKGSSLRSDYCRVPAGPAIVGRPHAAGSGSVRSATRDIGGFAICDHEVTVSDFLWFLNSEHVAEDRKVAPEMLRRSRTSEMIIWNMIKRDPDGRFSAVDPQVLRVPAAGVSFDQAEAYARWLTEQSARDGHPHTFSIPTDLEWEKAARGVDGRPYPYGNVFHAFWQKSGRSNTWNRLERGFLFPTDESPYGVFDMGGSLMEWCDRSEATRGGNDKRTLRGTAWSLSDQRAVALEWECERQLAMPECGFRVIAREEPASRPAAESRATSR